MNINNNPLEHLAAFAITFAAGIFATLGLGVYTKYVERKARKDT